MYTRRTADQELEERLGAAGAVLIEGPRACGKTETARRRAASEVLFDVDENALKVGACFFERVAREATARLGRARADRAAETT